MSCFFVFISLYALHYVFNFYHLFYFNNFKTNLGDPTRFKVVDTDLLNVLNVGQKPKNVLLLGNSASHYYYLTSDFTQWEPVSLSLSLFFKFGNPEWKRWFDSFKTNPADMIVVDVPSYDDIHEIPEFAQFMKNNYSFYQKIQNYEIYKLNTRI